MPSQQRPMIPITVVLPRYRFRHLIAGGYTRAAVYGPNGAHAVIHARPEGNPHAIVPDWRWWHRRLIYHPVCTSPQEAARLVAHVLWGYSNTVVTTQYDVPALSRLGGRLATPKEQRRKSRHGDTESPFATRTPRTGAATGLSVATGDHEIKPDHIRAVVEHYADKHRQETKP